MRPINTYIKENKSSLISLTEKFRVNSRMDFRYKPANRKALWDIIQRRREKMIDGVLDLNDIDVTNVTTFYSLFDDMQDLRELYANSWITTNCKNMLCMFNKCHNLEKVDIADWDVRNVETMWAMFHDCEKLAELDIEKWEVSPNCFTKYMFQNVNPKLKLPSWYINSNNI